MKKIILFALSLLVIFTLVGCSNTKVAEKTDVENTSNEVITNEVENTETESTETEVVEEAENGKIDPTVDTLDIIATAAWLDTLSADERWAWYEARFGKEFTDHVIDPYKEGWEIHIEGYEGMPCELLQLFQFSNIDWIAGPWEYISEVGGYRYNATKLVEWDAACPIPLFPQNTGKRY